MNSDCKLLLGDCLDVLKDVKSGSVDMVLADLPYGTTACKWDTRIPFEPLWEQLHRVCKPNAAMAMFGSEPFSSLMRMSNLKRFKYDWVWKKSMGTFATAKHQPLKRHEVISIFGSAKYNPQKTERSGKIRDRRNEDFIKRGRINTTSVIMGGLPLKYSDNYDPKMCYPISIIEFPNPRKGKVHPTQKPVALLEYLIKTYTNEGDTVLDPTMGSGSTGVACKNLGRNFIGIEMDKTYYSIAKRRIEDCNLQAEFK